MGSFTDLLHPYGHQILNFVFETDDWTHYSLSTTLYKVNEKLGIKIQQHDTYEQGAKMMKEKYIWLFCHHRHRGVLTEKTHKLLR